ncbi:MAG TPA: hypothetical protein VLC92_14410 [Rhodocyclaceae bacterium]|nr:hypothetical protein [Rhodocyclaceae bacterium]
MIGIDTNTGLAYEGTPSKYGRGLWPTPVITQAKLIEREEDWIDLSNAKRIEEIRLVFREDSFDPVTRVRRGRLYGRPEQGVWTDTWHNAPHPADPNLYGTQAGRVVQNLDTFHPLWNFGARVRSNPRMLLVLGDKDNPTIWRIHSVERISSGEDLVTLRARSSFGALPEILEDQIPELARIAVLQEVDHVADGAFRSGPVALIDLCRNAAVVVIGHWLVANGHGEKRTEQDLGLLIKALPEDRRMLRDAADVINLLHPRGKSNEREKLGLRKPTDEDAEIALNCLGMILREIGWAR